MATSNGMAAAAAAGSIVRQEFGAQQLARQAEMASSAAAAQAQAMVQARYVMALQRPRDWDEVRDRLRREIERPGFAESAWYRKPVGQGIEGLSVRFAEASARAMGNVLMDAPVVYDDDERRTVRVIVSDLEANLTYTKDVAVTKTVERRRLQRGQEAISARTNSVGETTYLVRATEDDLLAKEAAQVSKAFRTGILRILPGDLQDMAKARIKEILSGAAAKDPEGARRKIADAFSELGVTPVELKRYLGHDLASCSPAELTDLRGLYAAIKGGETTWADIVEAKLGPAEEQKPDGLAERIKAAAAQPAGPAPQPPGCAHEAAVRHAAAHPGKAVTCTVCGEEISVRPAPPAVQAPPAREREPGEDDGDDLGTAAAPEDPMRPLSADEAKAMFRSQASLIPQEAAHVDRPGSGRRGVR